MKAITTAGAFCVLTFAITPTAAADTRAEGGFLQMSTYVGYEEYSHGDAGKMAQRIGQISTLNFAGITYRTHQIDRVERLNLQLGVILRGNDIWKGENPARTGLGAQVQAGLLTFRLGFIESMLLGRALLDGRTFGSDLHTFAAYQGGVRLSYSLSEDCPVSVGVELLYSRGRSLDTLSFSSTEYLLGVTLRAPGVGSPVYGASCSSR